MASRPFLTARWEHLVMLNYVVDPAVLAPLLPAATVLDAWHDRTYVSLVGFRFRDTRLLGVPVPFHRHFEEVNLRFYVRREVPGEPPRRGVVFVRELVPRRAIAWLARVTYNEPYLAVPMSHAVEVDPERGGSVRYAWIHEAIPYAIEAALAGPAEPLAAGSEAEFITEHYWGYTRQRDGGTIEYRVEHPRWRVWKPVHAGFHGPAGRLYGDAFAEVLAGPAHSAFVALGSEIMVRVGENIA